VRSTALAGPLVGAGALLTIAACSSGLAVSPPNPPPIGAAAYTCSAVHGALPDEVDGHGVTATTPKSPLTSAWGQPPIVLRCGVQTPTALTPTSQLLTVDGVDWLPEQLTAGYLFTTVGRQVNVEVAVPDAYTPEADVLVDLSPVIAKLDPVTP
jgi:hypothetical protein